MSSYYKEIGGYSLDSFIHELPFYIGNIIKYAWRAPYKNGIDDTLKLLDYLDMSHYEWVDYSLSDKAVSILSEISNYDFYGSSTGMERVHRKCVSLVAEWILKSAGAGGSSNAHYVAVTISVSSMQVALLHNQA